MSDLEELYGFRYFMIGSDGWLISRYDREQFGYAPARCLETLHRSGYADLTNTGGPTEAHHPPEPDCTCGYYAHYRPPKWVGYPGMDSTFITAEVRALGRVELHDTGFRAERMEIVAIRAPACQNCGESATDFLSLATESGGGPSFRLTSLATCRGCFPRSGKIFSHERSVRDLLEQIAIRYKCRIKEAAQCRSDAEGALWSLRSQRIQEYLASLPEPESLPDPEPMAAPPLPPLVSPSPRQGLLSRLWGRGKAQVGVATHCAYCNLPADQHTGEASTAHSYKASLGERIP